MDIIETTIAWKGNPVRIAGGRVFLRAFGTTIHNHNMHHSWAEIKVSDLAKDLREYLKENKLIE